MTSCLFLPLFKTLLANIIDSISGVKNVVATLEIKIFEFFGKDATKNLLFGLSI